MEPDMEVPSERLSRNMKFPNMPSIPVNSVEKTQSRDRLLAYGNVELV